MVKYFATLFIEDTEKRTNTIDDEFMEAEEEQEDEDGEGRIVDNGNTSMGGSQKRGNMKKLLSRIKSYLRKK